MPDFLRALRALRGELLFLLLAMLLQGIRGAHLMGMSVGIISVESV
jgi:hypothetical protein